MLPVLQFESSLSGDMTPVALWNRLRSAKLRNWGSIALKVGFAAQSLSYLMATAAYSSGSKMAGTRSFLFTFIQLPSQKIS
jgi:hypothetical protein